MEDECTLNDNGKWKEHYIYVVYQNAYAYAPDSSQPHRIRDYGNDGKSLSDFANHLMAKEADLTIAEGFYKYYYHYYYYHHHHHHHYHYHYKVAALRMYTGPFYVPWNAALRLYDSDPTLLEQWQTCISVLYNAILKLSHLSKRGIVYRGYVYIIIINNIIIIIISINRVNESKLKIHEAFYKAKGDNFAGGVELAFMSTSTDEKIALEYARRGGSSC